MAEGTELGKAYVQIIPSAKGISGKIKEALGDAPAQAGESAGQSMGSSLVGKLKAVIAAAGIGAAFSKALTEGAALEQSIGGVETLFKNSADTIKQYAADAYKTAGVSANDYMEQVTSFSATLLQGLGGDTASAAKYANQAIVQMSDNANKMGTDIGSIQWAYQGFAKDNYTMLDNLKLGYGGTQAEMARLINDSGVLGDAIEVTAETVKDVPFSSIIDAIQVIQDNLGITGTTAKEAATTMSGSMASVKAAFSNVLAGLTLGQDIQPALNGLADTVTTFLFGNLLPAVGNILKGLPSAIGTFITSAGPQISVAIGQALGSVSPDLSGLWSSISSKLGELWASLSGAMEPLAGLLSSMQPLLQGVLSIVDAALGKIQGAVESIGPAVSSVTPLLQSVFDGIGTFVQGHADEIVTALASIAAGISAFKALTSVVSTITTVKTAITGVIGIIQKAGTVMKVIQVAIAALGGPVTIVIAAIAALTAGFIYLWNTCEPFKQFWIDLGTNIANFVSSAAQALVTFFTVTLPTGIQNALTFIQQLPTYIASFLTQSVTNVGIWVSNMVTKAAEMGAQFLSNVVTFFTQLPYNLGFLLGSALGTVSSWVINMVTKAIEMGTQFLQNVVTFFTQLPTNILSFITIAYVNVTTWVSQMVQSAINLGTQFLSNIVSFFSQLPGRILTWLTSALTNVAQWAVDLGQKGLEAAKNLLDNVVNGIKELPDRLLDIGKQAVEGLWNGIMAAKDWLTDKIGGFVSGIVDGFVSAFKIGSPSRVMRDEVGRWIAPGIAEGITGNMGSLTSAMKDVRDLVTGQMSGLQTKLTTALHVDPTRTVPLPTQNNGNQYIYFEQPMQAPDEIARALRIQQSYGLAGAR